MRDRLTVSGQVELHGVTLSGGSEQQDPPYGVGPSREIRAKGDL
jgi:hypothetical protein